MTNNNALLSITTEYPDFSGNTESIQKDTVLNLPAKNISEFCNLLKQELQVNYPESTKYDKKFDNRFAEVSERLSEQNWAKLVIEGFDRRYRILIIAPKF